MFKLTNHLSIGRKQDLESVLETDCNLIILSPWQQVIASTRIASIYPDFNDLQHPAGGKRRLFELINEEIPHYRNAQIKQIMEAIDQDQKNQHLILLSEHGQSRAPSMALLWLAAKARKLSRSSYSAARMDFTRIYPDYRPWPGMVIFLNQEWNELVSV